MFFLLCSSPRQLHAHESSGFLCAFIFFYLFIYFLNIYIFLGSVLKWVVLVLTAPVCVCGGVCSCTLPEQLRSALFLCPSYLMVWRRAGGEGLFMFTPVPHNTRSKVDPMETAWFLCRCAFSHSQAIALLLFVLWTLNIFIYSMLDWNLEITQSRGGWGGSGYGNRWQHLICDSKALQHTDVACSDPLLINSTAISSADVFWSYSG